MNNQYESSIKHRLQVGFTLVEVVVATALTGLLIIIIASFMASTLVQSTQDTARADLLSEAQIALDTANNDIRLSASADLNNRFQDTYAPGAPSNLLSWQSNASTLILATAVRNNSNTVLFEDALHYITYKNNNIYFVKNGTLYKRVLAANVSGNKATTTCPANHASASCPADSTLIHNVESFTVTYCNGESGCSGVLPSEARSIELRVKLKTVKYGQTIKADYTTRTVFRNE